MSSTRRNFDLSQIADVPYHRFGGVDAFLREPANDGVSEIMVGDLPFHAQFSDRGFDTTFVHFSAALPSVGWDTYPVFGGRRFAGNLPVNILSLSDPNYALAGRASTGWFLGSHDQPLREHLSSIIGHFTSRGVSGQAILFGSSAGGFASILYGAELSNSVTICINPRVDLLRQPTKFPQLAKLAFPDIPFEKLTRIVDISAADAYLRAPGNLVAYIQNVQDDAYFEGDLVHFLTVNGDNPRIALNLVDSGPGHRLPGGSVLTDLLGSLLEHAPDWGRAVAKLGYKTAPTTRFALDERLRLLGEAHGA